MSRQEKSTIAASVGTYFLFRTALLQRKVFRTSVHFAMSLCTAMSRQEKSTIEASVGTYFLFRTVLSHRNVFAYECPFCNELVHSNVKTGQIDHRSVCNNQFYVKDGTVSKQTRCHAHSCPFCSTVVWSSQVCGRIQGHDMPSGKPCHNKQWHVPEKDARTKKRKK